MKNNLNTIIIAIAIIISVFIAAAAFKYRSITSETIVVTGLAERDFISDQIVWSASFSRTGVDLRAVYASLKADETEIKKYLNNNGIADSSIIFSSTDIQKNYREVYDVNGRQRSSEFNGYTLIGNVTVDSRDIQKVEKLSREITGLLEKGIELNSRPPNYYYTRLNELKIDLLAKAAQDAKLRAETIAENSKAKLGSIKKANMGVFQITGKNSNEEFSYGGAFNTSSKGKTASITLRVEYIVR
jgi:uncharacterized protein